MFAFKNKNKNRNRIKSVSAMRAGHTYLCLPECEGEGVCACVYRLRHTQYLVRFRIVHPCCRTS